MKKTLIALTLMAALFGAAACEMPEDADSGPKKSTNSGTVNAEADGKKAADEQKKETKETPAQKNARKSAENYLEMSGMSRKGLIKQLKFEGYKQADAVYGADNSGAKWLDEAAEAAKNYLDMSAFSRAGLIKQLEFEGFTPQQAAHGAKAAGL